MVKRRVKKQRKIPPKMIFISGEETNNSLLSHPDATLTPDASLKRPTNGQWLPGDSTNAPKVGEEPEEQKQYAGTQSALIDKYLFSRLSYPLLLLPLIAAIVVIAFIFIQDNAAGQMKSWQEISWTIKKSGVFSGILVVLIFFILILDFLCNKVHKKY